MFSSAPRRAEKGRRRSLAAGPARAAPVCPGPDPPLRTWPFPSQASPSSGSASGSASRGRGFNNCSSCSASGPAIVTRSRSAPRSSVCSPGPVALSSPGPVAGRLPPRTARDRAEPSSRSSRPLPGGGGASVSLRALLGRRRKAVGIVWVPARVRVRGGGGGCEAVWERARARGRRWR